MYFSNFPRIYYDFLQDQTSESLQVLSDITANVRFRKEVLDNITLYDEYDIIEGETPEIIAEKFYGNPELHWIIMLFNQRYDYLRDFPMTNDELYQHCVATYGEDNLEDVHHYEKDGLISRGIANLRVPSNVIVEAKVGDIINALPKTRGKITGVDASAATLTLEMEFGRFTNEQDATLTGIRYNEDLESNVYTAIVNFVVPNNAFTINPLYDLVTNYEYELTENEKKRRIKLISPTLVNQIVREFNNLIVT